MEVFIARQRRHVDYWLKTPESAVVIILLCELSVACLQQTAPLQEGWAHDHP